MSDSGSEQPPRPPPQRRETPINDELRRREPDELDALLQRTAPAKEEEDEESNPLTNQQHPTYHLSITGSSIGHRKAHTAAGDLFHKAGLDRIGGLFRGDYRKSIRAHKRRQHRKNKSSLSDLIVPNLRPLRFEPIVEDFQHLSSSINNIWIEELEEMEQGTSNGFFDMTATRSLVST